MFFRKSRKYRQNDWKMDELHKDLEESLGKILREHNASSEDKDKVANLIQQLMPQFAQDLLVSLKRAAPSMLREHEKYRTGFAERNYRRWKTGFDKLYMLIVMSEELGQALDNAIRPNAAKNFKFEAISHLYARGFLIAREILCLMKAGFPDGALGRWRTLHEVAIIATFLEKHEQIISERYLLSQSTQAYKAAAQYRDYEEIANLTPFGEEDFKKISVMRDMILAQHGKEMKNDWGWAASVFGKEKPEFFDIEKNVGLDHWRPRYKWATQNTHPSHRSPDTTLAMCEKNYEGIAFPAESNSGMTDPAQMMAHSLVLVANAYVQLGPNTDRFIGLEAMKLLRDEIGETFVKLEAETLKAHQRRL